MGSLAITLALLDVLVMKLQGARTNAFGLADVSGEVHACEGHFSSVRTDSPCRLR